MGGRRLVFGFASKLPESVRPPLAGKRAAARRLADEVRRRLEPVERVLPVKLPRGGRAVEAADAPPAVVARERVEPSAQDAVARIDAARERLRATVEPPADPEA